MVIKIDAAPLTLHTNMRISFDAPCIASPKKKIRLTAPETPKRKASSSQSAKGTFLFTSPTKKIRRAAPYVRKPRLNVGKKSPIKANVFPPEEGLTSEATTVNNFALDDVPLDDAGSRDWQADSGLEFETLVSGGFALVDDESTVTNNDVFWDYVDTVLADALTFNEICEDLFVVQDWNVKSRVGGVRESTLHWSAPLTCN